MDRCQHAVLIVNEPRVEYDLKSYAPPTTNLMPECNPISNQKLYSSQLNPMASSSQTITVSDKCSVTLTSENKIVKHVAIHKNDPKVCIGDLLTNLQKEHGLTYSPRLNVDVFNKFIDKCDLTIKIPLGDLRCYNVKDITPLSITKPERLELINAVVPTFAIGHHMKQLVIKPAMTPMTMKLSGKIDTVRLCKHSDIDKINADQYDLTDTTIHTLHLDGATVIGMPVSVVNVYGMTLDQFANLDIKKYSKLIEISHDGWYHHSAVTLPHGTPLNLNIDVNGKFRLLNDQADKCVDDSKRLLDEHLADGHTVGYTRVYDMYPNLMFHLVIDDSCHQVIDDMKSTLDSSDGPILQSVDDGSTIHFYQWVISFSQSYITKREVEPKLAQINALLAEVKLLMDNKQ